MKDSILNVLDSGRAVIVGAGGVTGVQVATVMDIPGPDEIQSYGQLIIQILIGAATLYRLMRDNRREKKRRRKEDDTDDTLNTVG